ncbi:MAG: hypothetical protein CSA76_01025, partial [Spirochaetales bacterium]
GAQSSQGVQGAPGVIMVPGERAGSTSGRETAPGVQSAQGAPDSAKDNPLSYGGIQVEMTDDGVLLRIDESDNILFTPESAEISSRELVRLKRLARVLRNFDDRDILISGHTAHFGSEEGRRKLSLERAMAVAEVLFPGGKRGGAGKLYVRGMGSREPRGTDEENRRVEIIILD